MVERGVRHETGYATGYNGNAALNGSTAYVIAHGAQLRIDYDVLARVPKFVQHAVDRLAEVNPVDEVLEDRLDVNRMTDAQLQELEAEDALDAECMTR